MLQVKQTSSNEFRVAVSGDFDAELAQASRNQLDDIALNWQGNVIVDLSKTTFLDSSGIGAIVFLFKRLAERGFSLEIEGLEGQPRQVIQMLRIDQVISVRPNVLALAS